MYYIKEAKPFGLKALAPYIVLILAVTILAFTIYGRNARPQLQSLKLAVEQQRQQNTDLSKYVQELNTKVRSLQHDDRALEKSARNELGMMKDGEVMFIFEGENKK